MKNILFILSFLILASCTNTTEVEVGNKTSMVVEPVFDAGEVVKGEMISARFTVHNTGSYPLIIADVRPGCTCTIADKPEEPIMPGKSAVIKANVDTKLTSSKIISKSVRIVANTEPSVTEVVIKAKIK